MPDDENVALPPNVAAAVDRLRELPPLRSAVRDALLSDVGENRSENAFEERTFGVRTTVPRRRVMLTWPAALAAGLLCAIVGGGAATLVLRARQATSTVARIDDSSKATSDLVSVRFSLVAPSAASVSIVGDFNNWNPTALPMRRSADGRIWEIEVRLPLGRYNYAFLVDGRLARDPGAPSAAVDDFGTPNSVLMVRGS